MAQIPVDSREFVLGSGAAGGSLVAGLALAGVVATGRVGVLESVPVVAVLLVGAFVYGIGGLYDIVALGIPKRGVAHLVTGAGLVLALLAPYGTSTQLFVVSGAIALVVSAGYHAALVADIFSATEEPAAELDGDGDVS